MPKNLSLSSFEDEERLKRVYAVKGPGWFCNYYGNGVVQRNPKPSSTLRAVCPNIDFDMPNEDEREYYDEFYSRDTTPPFKASLFNLTPADYMICRANDEVITSEFLVCEETEIGEYDTQGDSKFPDLFITDEPQLIKWKNSISPKTKRKAKSENIDTDVEFISTLDNNTDYETKEVAYALGCSTQTIDNYRKRGYYPDGTGDNLVNNGKNAQGNLVFRGMTVNAFCEKYNIPMQTEEQIKERKATDAVKKAQKEAEKKALKKPVNNI